MSRNRSQQTLNQYQGGTTANNGRRESQTSQAYSPVGPISRTPSADRKLLRTLTVTPENDYHTGNYQDDDEQSYHPPPVHHQSTPAKPAPKSTSRNTVAREPSQNTAYLDGDTEQNTADPTPSARQTTQRTVTKSPTATYQGTSQRTPSVQGSVQRAEATRMSTVAERTVLTIPSPTPESSKVEDWQSNKSVAESNNYMLKYEVACDVTFAVGENKEEIRAHKYMLMARSPILFKSLVKHLGNTDVKIGVPDIKPDTFREMLQYVYTDEFDIHTDNVSPVLFAAKKFQLKGLSDLCFQYLASEMSDATVAKVMEQAHIYNENGLYDKCLRFIFANGTDVLRNPSFGQLCAECLEKILRSDELRATEEAVFEGSVIWANAECRRQKMQPTDEARREVLGKMLYLIRFPLMGVTYFTQRVSLGEMLSHDEKLSIFQYYHGEEQQLPQRFSRTGRKQIPKDIISMNDFPQDTTFTTNDTQSRPNADRSKVKRVKRFRTSDGQWKQNGPPDAISFTVSQPVRLYGIELFGTCQGTESYTVKLFLFDDISRLQVCSSEEKIYTNAKRNTYDLFFSKEIRVPARRVFTVVVALKGCPTYKGVDGERLQVVDGVTFEFIDSNRSSNGTDVTVGQIAGLIFNKTQ